jgi:hypothetical protein
MSGLRAHVENGRLILDEPTNLPEGTVFELVVDDEGDDLSEEERRRLHDALSASWKSAKAGRLRPASAIIKELRAVSVSLPVRTTPEAEAQISEIDSWWPSRARRKAVSWAKADFGVPHSA